MTVKELIKQLQDLPQEQEIKIMDLSTDTYYNIESAGPWNSNEPYSKNNPLSINFDITED